MQAMTLRALACVCLAGLCAAYVAAQEQPVLAQEAVRWDFEDGDIATWRHKDNATIAVVEEGGERGWVLEFATDYGEFGFAWMTNAPGGRLDFSAIFAVEFMLRGDGSGARVRPTLGVVRPGEPTLYYSAPADEITLDFEGWRSFALHITGLDVSRESNILDDLRRMSFVQFMVTAGPETERTTIAVDDIRAVPAEGERARELAVWREGMARLYRPMPRDGRNVLLNGGFEQSLDGRQPQFWRANPWGTDSRVLYAPEGGRESSAGVRIECHDEAQRGAWALTTAAEPGPYVFSAWAKADTPEAGGGRGPVARISFIDAEGRGARNIHVEGDPSEGAWQRIEQRFDVGPEEPQVQINLFNYFAAGSVTWDDVALAWDVAEAERRERERRQNLADLEEAQAMIVQATQELEALRERVGEPGPEETMALAMLDWALADAGLAIEAGLGTNARATIESAHEYMARFDEIMAQARAHRLERIDPDADANPYVATLNDAMSGYAVEPTVYAKGEEGYAQIENAWSFRTLGSNCLVMAWGLTHPRSAWHADPLLVRNLLTTMQAVLQNHRDGDWNPGRQAIYGADPNIPRFTLGPTFDAYWQLREHLPWLLLPAKEEEWLRELRVCVEHQYETYGLRNFTTGVYGAGNYPNQDVYYLLICELAHRVWGDQKFADHVRLFLDFLEATVYPMGGMIYHGTQNETFGYHNLNISFLARFLEYTGNEQARRIIEKTVEFYPIMVEPSCLVENYTDASWKHSNAWAHPHGPDIVATLTGDRQNKRVANLALARSGAGAGVHPVFAVPWWTDMPDEPLPDEYIIFDENVQAPRARFGPFSFAMNGRDFGPGQIGKDTFIGCMYAAFDRAPGEVGALLIATSEFRLQPEGIHWRNARYISGSEEFSSIIGGDEFASLAVRYRLTNPRHGGASETLPWEGTQQWFASRDRLVGLLHITALEDYECAGIWGRLRLGRGDTEVEPSPAMADTWKYGPLLVRIPAHNYAGIGVQPSEIFYLDEPERFAGREIILRDPGSATADDPEKRTTYAAGTDHWFVAEVLPYDSEFASEIAPIHDGDVRGLRFTEGDTTWFVLHNLGAEAVRWSNEVPAASACRLFIGGEVGGGQSLGRQDRVTLTLDPGQHVVVRAVAP